MKLRGVPRLFAAVGRGAGAVSMSWARAALLLAPLWGCNLDNPGVSPPRGKLAYPIAVELSTERNDAGEPRYLYVANSNFDVRYNAGSLQSYDLNALADELRERRCREITALGANGAGDPSGGDASEGGAADAGELDAGAPDGGESDGGELDGGLEDGSVGDAGESMGLPSVDLDAGDPFGSLANRGTPRGVLCDGRDPPGFNACCFDDNSQFLHSELRIDSFATGLALRPDGRRLYVPMRGANDVLYVAVNDGELSCGKDNGRCLRAARERNPDAPDESFPTQPTAIAVGTLADLGVTGSRAVDRFIATAHERGELSFFTESGKNAPILQDVSAGPNRTVRATSVTVDPTHRLLYVTSVGQTVIQRFGLRPRGDGVERDVLVPSTNVFLSGLSSNEDLRDLVIDSEDPTMLYALVRGVLESVVFLRLDSTTLSEARVVGATRVPAGPSKMIQATLGGRRLLFVSCYSARVIFIIDVESRRPVQVVRGLAGPFETVVDEARELMYVADFGASVLRVVDLEGVADRTKTAPRIIATLGKLYFAGDF